MSRMGQEVREATMDKLLELRVGGGRVRAGLLPLDSLRLFDSLFRAIKDEGGDPEAWTLSNPHIEILGAGSTRAAVFAERGRVLRKPVSEFRKSARRYKLSAHGVDFVRQNVTPSAPWDYIEVLDVTKPNKPLLVRFDEKYRERMEKELQKQTLRSLEDVYARVTRAGGENPPTAHLELLSGQSQSFPVKGKELAKELAKRLYELVKLRVDAEWDTSTMRIKKLTVLAIDVEWRDTHLATVMEEHEGSLPMRFEPRNEQEDPN